MQVHLNSNNQPPIPIAIVNQTYKLQSGITEHCLGYHIHTPQSYIDHVIHVQLNFIVY